MELHSALHLSDTVVTDDSGRVRILFNDDSTVSLGSNTRVEMSEYADSGESPRFGLNLPRGVIRAITGKIVDTNPEGFKITTPEATVGIRGTILSLRALDGQTTVYVENTLRQVYVNGVRVPGGQKITIPADPAPRPLEPEDRRSLGREFALRGGAGVAAAAPEPVLRADLPPVYAQSATESPLPPDSPLAEIAMGPQGIGDSILPFPMIGHVNSVGTATSMFISPGINIVTASSFSFDVNLTSGAIFNGALNITGTVAAANYGPGGPLSVAGTGGTGATVMGVTLMDTFSTLSVLVGGIPITGAHALVKAPGDVRPLASGTTILFDYNVEDASFTPIDYGQGPGVFTK